MKRGDLYWADLAPRSGSEQQGRRPVIVVSSDGFNQVPTWRSTIVIPMSTSESKGHRGPTVVRIPQGAAGLDRSSFALCHQVTTLDRSKLVHRIGTLDPELLERLEDGLRAALDLE